MKTAIVTGGCSGIGLALVQHLLSKTDWQVVVGDIQAEGLSKISAALDEKRTLFVQTNVASWDENANLFKKAYEFSKGRIDFFAANAGIGDKELVAQPFDLDAEPQKPDLSCIEVNEIGVFYGLKLFIHYSRKTQRAVHGSKDGHTNGDLDHSAFNPKMVITASCVGLYPLPIVPQYTASKHSLVGLTRSVGKNLYATDNIAVNCIMPAYVATNIAPPGLNEAWPQKWITPFSTMNRAYDELIDEHGKIAQDGLSDGKNNKVKAGQAVECVVDKLYYRDHYPFADESQKFCIEQSFTPDGLWVKYMLAAIEKGQNAA